MILTGKIILKLKLFNWDMKEWTGVAEIIQGIAFVIMMTNLQAHSKAVNLLPTLLSKALTFQGTLYHGVNHSGSHSHFDVSCFGRNGIVSRRISALSLNELGFELKAA
jgi:hypothetical protein